MSRRQHGYPWPSLATSPYHSSPPAGLQGYILCPHIVAVCKFVLVVLLLHIHMWGSTGVHRLWARPCMVPFCCSWQIRNLSDEVFLSNTIFWRVRLLLESLYFLGRCFSYSLIIVMDIWSLHSFNPKIVCFYWGFPVNKHSWLANHLQIISSSLTTFWLVSQSNALIYVCNNSLPSA